MMMRITLPGSEETLGEDKKIIPYSVRECKFASNEGAEGDKKHNKGEQASVMKKPMYHVRKREDVLQEGPDMKLEGLPVKGAHVGLLGRYNLYVDPELGVGKAMLQQIPCACAPCKEFTKHPWKSGVPAKTNLALNRIGCVSTGKFLRVRTTGFLYKQQKKASTHSTLNNHRRRSWEG
jgi:hypothetical protein